MLIRLIPIQLNLVGMHRTTKAHPRRSMTPTHHGKVIRIGGQLIFDIKSQCFVVSQNTIRCILQRNKETVSAGQSTNNMRASTRRRSTIGSLLLHQSLIFRLLNGDCSISIVVDEATSPAARDSSPRPLRRLTVVFRAFFSGDCRLSATVDRQPRRGGSPLPRAKAPGCAGLSFIPTRPKCCRLPSNSPKPIHRNDLPRTIQTIAFHNALVTPRNHEPPS